MANIAISDLNPVGFNLLSTSDSYMSELSNEELNTLVGGAGSYDDLPILTDTGEFKIVGLTVDFNDLIRRALKLK